MREERDGKVERSVYLLGVDLSHLPSSLRFILLSCAVFLFYLLYGYYQELLFRLPGFAPFGWYLTLYQFLLYVLLSSAERLCLPEVDRERKIPLRIYAQLALYTVATMGLSNSSLGYLNYPTQVIFKCCKLIPVLIGGIIIQGKRFGVLDVVAALLMSVGLILFTLADSRVLPEFHAWGYALISGALVADAIIGNVQEKALRGYGATSTEMVLYSYGLGSLYVAVGVTVTGELWEASSFFAEHPVETYGYGAVFAATGFMGVKVVLTLVREYGALVAVTVTTCRKGLTICLSFLFFTKPFTLYYIPAGLVVLAGIYLNVYAKRKTDIDTTVLRLTQAFRQRIRGSPKRRDLSEIV